MKHRINAMCVARNIRGKSIWQTISALILTRIHSVVKFAANASVVRSISLITFYGRFSPVCLECDECPDLLCSSDCIKMIFACLLFICRHTGETPHRCDFCSKTFTRKEHLLNHVRQHTNESPHRC